MSQDRNVMCEANHQVDMATVLRAPLLATLNEQNVGGITQLVKWPKIGLSCNNSHLLYSYTA